MRIITSDKIAEKEGFQEIVSSDPTSKPKKPRFDLTPVPLDRSKRPSRKQVEEGVRRGEKEIEAELNRSRKGLYSNDGIPLSDVIINS